MSTRELEATGLDSASARVLAKRANDILKARALDRPENQVRAWMGLRAILLERAPWRWNFAVHLIFFRHAFRDRRPEDGPAPAWIPSPDERANTNLSKLVSEVGVRSYAELHRWSVADRGRFWGTMVRHLGIAFRTQPGAPLAPRGSPTNPDWFPGARLNIAESCFLAERSKAAIVTAREGAPGIERMTYGELRRLAGRIANGLDALRVPRGGRVALYLPMTPESVAVYLGVVLAGRCAVGIGETSAPSELAKRASIADTKVVFTIESYRRDGKDLPIYAKVLDVDGPPAVVLPPPGEATAKPLRSQDRTWQEFLSDRDAYDAVACDPSSPTNILFSSGTTKEPKAIVWTHTTPIKCAADAHLHHDVRPSDVLAWPTSFGWMMGPWLTYAGLVNRATIALFVGAPTRREFGEFVAAAGVTMLGVVPKLVRAWKADRAMEDLDWRRIRLFSSTAEPSTPDEMLYLMSLAGYKPVVEYCGGTEVGGGYLTGTVVQPCAPSMFTTPAMGLDLAILDDGAPADRGEVFLVPPSIGLSNELLNYDNEQEYYAGCPLGPKGERLRRHGDQIERLGGGFYRHLGRIDDVINIHGVKTNSEELRSVLWNDAVLDTKPVAVDVDGSGQHALVIYAVPKDPTALGSDEARARLRRDFQGAIKARLNPLLAHVHDVVLVPELPQAGPGKTRTMKELARDYASRVDDR